MIRNTIAVLVGIFVAMIIVTIAITLNSNWIEYDYHNYIDLYDHWRKVIVGASRSGHKNEFFLALLFSSGFGALFGGIVTATIVKNAKKAYAVFTGFILFLIALGDIIFTPSHPTWYELSIMPVLFFFSWLGGLCVDLLTNLYRRTRKATQQVTKKVIKKKH